MRKEETKETIKKDFRTLASARRHSHMADMLLAGRIGNRIRERLEYMKAQGRDRWWDSQAVSTEQLKQYLQRNIDEGDMLDAICLASMILIRESELAKDTGRAGMIRHADKKEPVQHTEGLRFARWLAEYHAGYSLDMDRVTEDYVKWVSMGRPDGAEFV